MKFFGNASEMGQAGKWKFNSTAKQIELLNIQTIVASPPPYTTDNRTLKLIEFSDSSFKIREKMNGDKKPELSIYQRTAL